MTEEGRRGSKGGKRKRIKKGKGKERETSPLPTEISGYATGPTKKCINGQKLEQKTENKYYILSQNIYLIFQLETNVKHQQNPRYHLMRKHYLLTITQQLNLATQSLSYAGQEIHYTLVTNMLKNSPN